jgi:hypothetical protein
MTIIGVPGIESSNNWATRGLMRGSGEHAWRKGSECGCRQYLAVEILTTVLALQWLSPLISSCRSHYVFFPQTALL